MLNACLIGLGQRGYNLSRDLFSKSAELNVVSICDIYEDRLERAAELYVKAGKEKPLCFTNYKDALNVAKIDVAMIFSDWNTHAEIAIYCMEKGIPVGSEVGCEYTLENCYNLVRTQERTGTPYMLMENCCWDKEEMLVTAMARKGMFGTIVHCQGSYSHDLRREIVYGHVKRHYRFDNYLNRCCDQYPTHDLGPIAKILDINRGNRILTVSSFATKSVGLEEYIKTLPDATDEMKNARFKQGDIVTSVLTCANGETIVLRIDTCLPRFYSRDFTIRGTKGMYTVDTNSFFFDGQEHGYNKKEQFNNAENYYEEFLPKIWKEATPEVLAAGHGGMDYHCYTTFFNAIKNNLPMPVDVYDSATWQAVSVLSELSVINGGAPQQMPDFTNGKWYQRKRLDVYPFNND